jgi:hypothetical protein
MWWFSAVFKNSGFPLYILQFHTLALPVKDYALSEAL